MKQRNPDIISISKSRVNNLKNLSVTIPKKKLVVITGLSGSGKSSLAFDTLFAEGQRRYVESLSSYARQFLGRMDKPEVDSITGIAPAIAIEQKVKSRNPRSTVGTSTEVYEYIKLLFARIGKTYSPISNKRVKRNTLQDVVNYISQLTEGTVVIIYTPLEINNGRDISQHLQVLLQQGFNRVLENGHIKRIEEIIEQGETKANNNNNYFLVIDRIIYDPNDEDMKARVADSAQVAFYEGNGNCIISYTKGEKTHKQAFSNKFELDGIKFEEPSINMFTFNNPLGACKKCEGFGSIIGIDPDLVIPNPSLSIYDEAIACWKGEKMSEWKYKLIKNAHKFDFPIHRPYYELTSEQKELLWTGNDFFSGINAFFSSVEEQTYKIQYRVMLSRYRGKTLCPDCMGTRLRKDTNYIKVGGKNVSEIVRMQLDEAYHFFIKLELDDYDLKIAKRLLFEITSRLKFLIDVGLSYLTMNRLSSSLSGGESQRINLATSLGSSLVGSMYILDEPSIGLHPRDTKRLLSVLYSLRDIGNSVIVVEHDEEIIMASDYIIDIGPDAGEHGGELVFEGNFDELKNNNKSYTALYLTNRSKISIPEQRRKWRDYIEIKNATQNNLKDVNVKIPLNILLVVTGVSGSGKSTLVKDILYPALKRNLDGHIEKAGKHGQISGELSKVKAIEYVDQNPIGRSSRSNPATYLKAFDDIRSLFASEKLAKLRGFKPGYFSFNVPGGRCDQCEGEGVIKVEMQFMADIYLKCDSCNGNRFKSEVLEIKYNNQSISDILNLTVDQALQFFKGIETKNSSVKKIISKIQPLENVGLGYLRMGQPSNTLSGGEAQRIKLAYFLAKGGNSAPTLFVFDEPTTGLHIHDISKLLHSLNSLIEIGHSVLVIEHNTEVIKSADWIIDLGPEGGDGGGEIVFEGIPEELIKSKVSHTGKYLKKKLNN
ncbi:MAG: excinuclease ABC subunit A [Lentimicrobiaceae bacterium]|jgi:excinuclease ABC subunit A|nr:excinuclease ABC subunit A [Lentimicrobiaceae bacterium]MDG1901201.1 excinuclease ABC subunit UvrA [Bacteroidales bacterium]|tara:strand:- start:2562 stop:5378 length:2817 start_codon:yes stop_codon:yes gene_type:complete